MEARYVRVKLDFSDISAYVVSPFWKQLYLIDKKKFPCVKQVLNDIQTTCMTIVDKQYSLGMFLGDYFISKRENSSIFMPDDNLVLRLYVRKKLRFLNNSGKCAISADSASSLTSSKHCHSHDDVPCFSHKRLKIRDTDTLPPINQIPHTVQPENGFSSVLKTNVLQLHRPTLEAKEPVFVSSDKFSIPHQSRAIGSGNGSNCERVRSNDIGPKPLCHDAISHTKQTTPLTFSRKNSKNAITKFESPVESASSSEAETLLRKRSATVDGECKKTELVPGRLVESDKLPDKIKTHRDISSSSDSTSSSDEKCSGYDAKSRKIANEKFIVPDVKMLTKGRGRILSKHLQINSKLTNTSTIYKNSPVSNPGTPHPRTGMVKKGSNLVSMPMELSVPCAFGSGAQNTRDLPGILRPNYEAMTDFTGIPSIGDVLAYKVLELKMPECTPEISDYYEGIVQSVSANHKLISLKVHRRPANMFDVSKPHDLDPVSDVMSLTVQDLIKPKMVAHSR